MRNWTNANHSWPVNYRLILRESMRYGQKWINPRWNSSLQPLSIPGTMSYKVSWRRSLCWLRRQSPNLRSLTTTELSSCCMRRLSRMLSWVSKPNRKSLLRDKREEWWRCRNSKFRLLRGPSGAGQRPHTQTKLRMQSLAALNNQSKTPQIRMLLITSTKLSWLREWKSREEHLNLRKSSH